MFGSFARDYPTFVELRQGIPAKKVHSLSCITDCCSNIAASLKLHNPPRSFADAT
jgi:hypothetical protein